MDEAKKAGPARFLLAAVLFTMIAFIIHYLGAAATMNYYMDAAYFPVWSKIMMPAAGPPPLEFTLYSLVFGFITALIFVFAYAKLRPVFGSKSAAGRGLRFGCCLFFLSAVPGSLTLFLLINLPAALIAAWAAESLIAYLIGSVVIAKIMK